MEKRKQKVQEVKRGGLLHATTRGSGLAIAGSLEYLADTSKSLSLTKNEMAVKILESEYSDLLTLNERVIAGHLFVDFGKATVFTAMKAGTLYDARLRAEIDAF